MSAKIDWDEVGKIMRERHKRRYEDVLSWLKVISSESTVLPPPWDELTPEQQEKVIAENKRYDQEMYEFGKQLSKEPN